MKRPVPVNMGLSNEKSFYLWQRGIHWKSVTVSMGVPSEEDPMLIKTIKSIDDRNVLFTHILVETPLTDRFRCMRVLRDNEVYVGVSICD